MKILSDATGITVGSTSGAGNWVLLVYWLSDLGTFRVHQCVLHVCHGGSLYVPVQLI